MRPQRSQRTIKHFRSQAFASRFAMTWLNPIPYDAIRCDNQGDNQGLLPFWIAPFWDMSTHHQRLQMYETWLLRLAGIIDRIRPEIEPGSSKLYGGLQSGLIRRYK